MTGNSLDWEVRIRKNVVAFRGASIHVVGMVCAPQRWTFPKEIVAAAEVRVACLSVYLLYHYTFDCANVTYDIIYSGSMGDPHFLTWGQEWFDFMVRSWGLASL